MPALQPIVHRTSVRAFHPGRLALALLLGLCGPGACASQPAAPGPASGPGDRPAQLLDTEWAFVEIVGVSDPLPSDPPAGAPSFTLASAGARFTGSTGCNRMQGNYEHGAAGTLRFGPVAATKRGCPPVLAGVEKGVLDTLAATTRYVLEEGRLELRAADRVLARLSPASRTAR